MGTRSAERTEFLGDIITTACEGGTGHWAYVTQYQYVLGGEVSVCVGGVQVGDEARAELEEMDGGKTGMLTLGSVAAAIGKIKAGTVSVGGYAANAIIAADRENDAGELDADLADVIAQVAVLGELVYG